MRQLAVLTIALIAGAGIAQAQEAVTPAGDAKGQKAPPDVRLPQQSSQQNAVQLPQRNDTAPGAQSDVQRPIRRRLRDPNNCQAAEGRPIRQRLRDPANCQFRSSPDWGAGRGVPNWCGRQGGAHWVGRHAAANWRGHRGMGWRAQVNNGVRVCNRPGCPNYGGRAFQNGCGFHGGRHHGWGRGIQQPPARASQPSVQE
jgi:hypothetical protein